MLRLIPLGTDQNVLIKDTSPRRSAVVLMRAAMQVRRTQEPNSLEVFSFLTRVFLAMFTLKLKKYYKLDANK